MKNNFTTPAFAKVLKEHGIEIDTSFMWHYPFLANTNGYHLIVSEGNYTSFDIDNDNVSIVILGFYECESKVEVLPAYPLTEVLGWLPNVVTIKKIPCNLEPMDAKSGKYRYLGTTHWDVEQTKFLSIEALITQGLTEGWLTKETILQAIKDNAK
jgi:hypothetical protein